MILKEPIKCEFCGKWFVKGDNIVSLVASRPNTHHHLKCVIEAAILEERALCLEAARSFSHLSNPWTIRELIVEAIEKRGQPEEALRGLIWRSVLEEREACANIAETHQSSPGKFWAKDACDGIAEAIRKRGS